MHKAEGEASFVGFSNKKCRRTNWGEGKFKALTYQIEHRKGKSFMTAKSIALS
jgi:hypothetical protein